MTHKAKEKEQEGLKKPEAKEAPEAAEVETLKKEAAGLYERLLRNQAESENFQKRMQKERAEFARFATEGLVNDLLPVMDDLERAIEAAEKSKDFETLAGGVKLILNQLKGVLERVGLKDVRAEGQPFDPTHHEAVRVVETDEHQETAVVEELRKGYLLNERVLRPAMVAVAKKKNSRQS